MTLLAAPTRVDLHVDSVDPREVDLLLRRMERMLGKAAGDPHTVWRGIGHMRLEIPRKEMDLLNVAGVELVRADKLPRHLEHFLAPAVRPDGSVIEDSVVLFLRAENAFINLGLHFLLDRLFNINTPNAAISHFGLSDDTTAVTAATLLLDPTPAGDSPKIRALASGVNATATTRTGNTVSANAGWAKSDFTTTFNVRKMGLLNTSTDAGDDTTPTVQGVMNIIGGTGGASPYNEPFSVDLTGFTDFNFTPQIDVTPAAT